MTTPDTPPGGTDLPRPPAEGLDPPLRELPPPKGRRGLIISLVLAVIVVLGGTGLLIYKLTYTGDRVSVRIGTTEASADYWPILVNLAAENDIDIRVVNFGDFTQPNPALAQGQLDLNLFQHLLFLANYNESAGQTLTPIGSTVINPLGIYSRRHDALDQIPQGGQVVIPNDPTNQSRALLVLQEAGLISLRDGGNVLSTPAEIDTAASRVRVVPVDARQTVTSLPSVDAAVINNNFALDANLDPTTALYNDDPASAAAEPYINVFVAREADKDNPTYLKIAELYHDPAVTTAVVNASKGTAVIVDRPRDELETILAGLQSTVGN